MLGSQLRRTGFAAVVVTGLALTGSAVHGIGGMDSSLELAAVQEETPRTAVAHHWCPERGPERS
jgi:hypothetical protein